MARVMDDAARAQMLSKLLDQNIGQPATRGTPITDTDVEEEDSPEGTPMRPPVDPRGAPPAMPGNEMSQQEQPPMMQPIPGQPGMVAVPKPLAMSAMAMLMRQGSANSVGQSRGANGSDQPEEDAEDE